VEIHRLSQYFSVVKAFSAEFLVNPRMALAIVYQESAGDTYAARVEEDLVLRWVFPAMNAKKHRITMTTEITFQKTSWGLMQVLGVVARELGYDEQLPKLTVPNVGLRWGIKNIAKLQGRYLQYTDIIAAYNAGSPKKVEGKYKNQEYVDSVMKHMAELEGVQI
jgi:soluble lytic murein transglycosylase-like protein